MRRSTRGAALLAVLVAFLLVAAACGSDGDDDATEGADGESTTTEGDDSEGSDAVAEGDATGADEREAGEAVYGGRLVYGIEADSANPWAHYSASCAISCRMILRAISDPLFMTDEDGQIQPYLASSAEPNDDLTVWTITVRDGITFHDGTPLDGAAVKYNMDICRKSGLTGPAYSFVQSVAAEGQTVTVTFNAPYAVPQALWREEVCGNMLSPAWLRTLPDNPLRDLTPDDPAYDEETTTTEPTGDNAEPVGLGAFVFDSYSPGNGNSFIATRNEDYWRGDGPNATGEGLPYLDEVEFVAAVDIQSRVAGLESGQFDIIHTANADEISKFVDNDDFTLLQANDYGETSHILLNVATGDLDPDGTNASSPLIHETCRRALAHAIDTERLAEERDAGLVTPANGPFPPGSAGYLEDSGYPTFDPAAAQTEMEACLADAGTDSIEFTFNTTNDPFNVETNQLVASMWQETFGNTVNATIAPIEQGQYIGLAIVGTFQAQGWRNHGGVDPGEQFFWWFSQAALPIGTQALNFGRFQDPEMDQAILGTLTQADPEARKAAAEEINRLFGEHVYNWWTTWTLWGIIADPSVQNLTALELPDGGTSIPVIAGKHQLAQIWCTDGSCGG